MSDIVDVDFRYVMREDIYSDEWHKPRIKVLQWRKKVPIIDDTMNGPVPYIVGYGWTDWQDVRTEEE